MGRTISVAMSVAIFFGTVFFASQLRAEPEEPAGWREVLATCIAMTGTAPETASGRELPRFVELRFGTVNLRQGPDNAHRINWVYLRKGLPLLVIAEHHNWRRVCDMEGTIGWIHRSQLAAVQNVMAMSDLVPLRSMHELAARIVAQAEKGALLQLERCFEEWCLIGRGPLLGWAPRGELWGVLSD